MTGLATKNEKGRNAMTPPNGTAERVWDLVMKAAVPVVIGACGALIHHEIRLSRIEESRFTSQEAAALEMRIIERPQPEWLKAMLGEIRAELKRVNERLGELERRP